MMVLVRVRQYWQQLDHVPCYDLKYGSSERGVMGEYHSHLRELTLGIHLSRGL